MKAVRTLGALVVLAVLLVGVPWLLASLASPAYLLEADWSTALLVHADSRLWLAILSLVGWVAWGVLALALAFEAIAVASRQRIRLAVPGLGWLQPALGTLILAIATSPAVASPSEAPTPGEVPQPVSTAESAPSPPEASPTAAERSYVVLPGDELWNIAERELGSGERWREIAALNDLTGPRIEPGQLLRLPEVDPAGTVAVAEGDSLWSIAAEELDDPTRWREIHELNAQQIPDADLISPGMRLTLPNSPESTTPASPEPTSVAAEPVEEAAEPADKAAEPVEEAAEDPVPIQPPAAGAESEQEPAPTEPSAVQDSEPQPERAVAEQAVAASQDSDDAALATALWSASLSSVLAAGVVATLAARRRAQLQARPVGRRIPSLAPGAPLLAGLVRTAQKPATAEPVAGTLLGWTEADEPVTLDLEAARLTVFLGPSAEGVLAALVTSLLCGPQAVRVVLPGGQDWAEALDEPRVTAPDDVAAGLAELSQLCAQRRVELRSATLAELRADPDRAELWQPVVFVFQHPLSPAEAEAAAEALRVGEVGVSVVLASTVAPAQATIVTLREASAELRGRRFVPQRLPAPARRALIDLLAASGSTATEPAPWWEAQLPANVRPLNRQNPPRREESTMTPWPTPSPHPRLLLLGDVELRGAAGKPPTRAVQQCLEYCAWLLEHPGATPTAMLRDLVVAETTRRSNMSRLRTWLGRTPDGGQYLPDAYSGRIALDPRVDSDWDRLRALTAGGVNQATTPALIEALSLVRGAPLGAHGFLWPWAEQLRTDMISLVLDVACVLVDRAIAANDPERALWALGQARLLGEDSFELTVREIHALALAGRRDALDAAVVRLSRATRGTGRDLAPELARRVQYALRHVSSAPSAQPSAPSAQPSAPSAPAPATPRRAQ